MFIEKDGYRCLTTWFRICVCDKSFFLFWSIFKLGHASSRVPIHVATSTTIGELRNLTSDFSYCCNILFRDNRSPTQGYPSTFDKLWRALHYWMTISSSHELVKLDSNSKKAIYFPYAILAQTQMIPNPSSSSLKIVKSNLQGRLFPVCKEGFLAMHSLCEMGQCVHI